MLPGPADEVACGACFHRGKWVVMGLMLFSSGILGNMLERLPKRKVRKERLGCEETGNHSIDSQTWCCLNCDAIVPVMMTPALPC
jgi:hypothetical protein